MAENQAQRTEKPTGKRLQEARRRGQLPRTKELSSVFVLAMFLVFAHLFGGDWLRHVKALLVGFLGNLAQPELTASQWIATAHIAGRSAASLMFLPVGLLAVASMAGNLMQGSPVFTLQPLKPDLSRINPFQGIKKVFAMRSLAELAKAVLKMLLFTTVALMSVRDALVGGLPGSTGAEGALAALFAILGKVIFRIALLWLVLAVLDILYTRYQYMRDLRMTKQEVKEERKQLEGDPRVKAKIRSKQYEAARARMMDDVPNATVVVTNPTHIAVALRYRQGVDDVPQLLAKGQALLAERIRAIATEHRIPIIQDPPLARALYKSVAVGGFVPQALFRAVAEILALVLRRRDPRRTHRPRETRP